MEGIGNTINYDVGKNTSDDYFIRITDYTGGGNYSKDWFSILDLSHLFISANGHQVSSFEPFDNFSKPLQQTHNNNLSAFLKTVLINAFR